MDQKMVLVGIAIVLVAFAVIIAVSGSNKPPVTVTGITDTKGAQDIMEKGLSFGSGFGDYTYSYIELSDGYKVSYTLTKNGGLEKALIINPLSTKNVYYLSDDTVLCITFGAQVACSSVGNYTDMTNYLQSIQADFLNDTTIQRFKSNTEYLLNRGYLRLSPQISDSTVLGNACKEITYTIDFNNATVSDGALFGIGVSSPKTFDWRMCIDNKTGYVHSKSFSYTLNGLKHSYNYTLVELKNSPIGPITAPENISQTNEAVQILFNERESQVVLANCYTTLNGDALDKCVGDLALNLRRTDICAYAGGRRDRCLVSLVPLVKDATICLGITNASFKDDCYIELAGAFKNSTYCKSVVDQSKVSQCNSAATPLAANETVNQHNAPINSSDLVNYVDKYNTTTTGNGTGK